MLSISKAKVPDEKNPLLCAYDPKDDSLVPLGSNGFDLADDNTRINELLVPTSNLLVAYTIIQQWFVNKEHVMLIGPEASGKRYYNI